jgi:epoxyqueuosine reductase
MFYMSSDALWRWKMNVARVMGNTCDRKYTNALIREFEQNSDERVQGMIAWALGKLGGVKAKKALEKFGKSSNEPVREEISEALRKLEL